ncbi:MAG: HslU--HslV peptidase ATPase subunit [Chloroflexi bacterium RBG_13_53_26]|nr:MAG: HslU--HslV peptidase ATPase subunit [Chloroflexi bacterium RBG_13_53_26]
MTVLTPRSIVEELDRYVIGQQEAKRVVAIALSNRERRRKLPPEIRSDVMPKNILMIGPTGVGKTEIARRLAVMMDAPFAKAEATKFTEVGYVGRDVESIIHDLVEVSAARVYREELKQIESNAEKLAIERIASYLYQQLTRRSKQVAERSQQVSASISKVSKRSPSLKGKGGTTLTREKLAKLLASHKLEDQLVEIEVGDSEPPASAFDPRLEMDIDDDSLFDEYYRNFRNPNGQKKRKVRVKEARRILTREEANKLLDFDQVIDEAIRKAEENGIVFLDEIDKICGPKLDLGRDISGEGVQRDLLPLLEGTTVATRYGPVKTEHILFVAAGTFSRNKSSDLIPELQGRFPLRVELNPLSQQDLERILVEPRNSLIKQYEALLATEGVNVVFTEDGIQEMARLAVLMNEHTENIGARRLFTIVEKLVEDLSFTAPERKGQQIEIDAKYVIEQVGSLVRDENLGRYIL